MHYFDFLLVGLILLLWWYVSGDLNRLARKLEDLEDRISELESQRDQAAWEQTEAGQEYRRWKYMNEREPRD